MRAVTDAAGYDHLISLPPAAATQAETTWPVMMFLHGAGERGHDVWAVARQGVPRLLAFADDLTAAERRVAERVRDTCVMIAPQCPQYEVWNEHRLLELLDSVLASHRVDPRRVYLTGLSMGGFGTWTLGLRHPHRFAALLPICGGGRIADVLLASDRHGDALRRLGIWAFHGANDRVVPVEESDRMVRALEAAHVRDVKLTVYPEAEHDVWTPTYANAAVYDWLFGHQR